ncbi:cell wall-associated NlpC family hydrolase [Microterricola gilva]|uniref:Cell wall-associated NlpC family hydrolase n=1 Tax=Microterricola gilva TaxID=393267 RepID=A0A4V2GAT5_9MICO|nr:C40 family peptidase [Microterricola gilva]RZU65536.1 cell wall-associated NlpC family hydrolase [Microterricola gilva]
MTAMVEMIGRVQSIQEAIDQLSGAASSRTVAQTDAGSGSSATDFSKLLGSAIGAAEAGSTRTGGVTGQAVTDAAMKYIGVPYVFGGEDASGMDCSGLVQRVYADLGIEVPRLVSGQMTAGTEVASLAEAQPGDLIVTDNAEHIVIYAGDNKVIHAPYEGRTVSHVERWFDESDIVTIRRIVPTATTGTAGATAIPAADQAALNEAMLAIGRSALFGGAQ